MFIYIDVVVFQRVLPSLDVKLESSVTIKWKIGCQTRVRQTIDIYFIGALQTRTFFVTKKIKKTVAKFESDRIK